MVPPMIWDDFFRAGGLGMFPTAINGFLLLAAAMAVALRPSRRVLVLVASLGALTLGSGVLASIVGIVSTLHFAARSAPARMAEILAMGTAEALHCLVLALLTVQVALGLVAVAAWRISRQRAGA